MRIIFTIELERENKEFKLAKKKGRYSLLRKEIKEDLEEIYASKKGVWKWFWVEVLRVKKGIAFNRLERQISELELRIEANS